MERPHCIGIQKSSVHVLQEYLEDKTYLDNYTAKSKMGQTGLVALSNLGHPTDTLLLLHRRYQRARGNDAGRPAG